MYIYCHPQTDCFVLSELFSVARQYLIYIYIYIYIYMYVCVCACVCV